MNDENLLRYRMAMEMFTNWFREGTISLSDLSVIDTKMAEKYGVDSSSIYRPECLLLLEHRANMSPTEEGGETL